MSFPGDPSLQRQEAKQQGAPDNEHHNGKKDAPDATFKPTCAKEVGEVSEDDPTGADMNTWTGHKPDPDSPNEGAQESDHPEVSFFAEEDETSEEQDAERVVPQMSGVEMKQRVKGDAEEATDGTGLNAEILECAVKEECARELDKPDGSDEGADRCGAALQVLPEAGARSLGLGRRGDRGKERFGHGSEWRGLTAVR